MSRGSKHTGVREIWAVVLVGFALLLFLSLVSHDPFDVGNGADSSRPSVNNFIGPAGAWVSFITFQIFGLGSYVFMLVLGGFGIALLLGREMAWPSRVGASALLIVASDGLLHLLGLEGARVSQNLPSAGGFVGLFIGGFFEKFLGKAGSIIIFSTAYLVSLIVLINLRPSYWVALGAAAAKDFWLLHRDKFRRKNLNEQLNEEVRDLRVEEFKLRREVARKERETRNIEGQSHPEPRFEDRTAPKSEDRSNAAPAESKITDEKEINKNSNRLSTQKKKSQSKTKKEDLSEEELITVSAQSVSSSYELPPLNLLERPPAVGQRGAIEDLRINAEMLQSTLEDFGITVQLGDVTKGPTITRYEVYPAPGVKVEKITSLSNNIALAMKAVNVRILAPVPGKGTVGIEVPNSMTTTVYLRDVLESTDWQATKAKIPIVLGRDVAGNPIIADLADMPHLLIAGATGSGKTVCVNAILATLLFRFTPDDLRLVLIDPKVVEMQQYNVLPHLIVPVVTDAKKVPLALRWVINEMEKRFQILAKAGVRNIAGFNARPKKGKVTMQQAEDEQQSDTEPVGIEEVEAVLKIEVPRDSDIQIPDKLPYIVVVIDELADLMLVAPADIETAIARLAQLSRAVGIHMILATQRPSVDVLTGVIKANFPARVAFQVASKQDSRVILDANGADKLLGKGDMLYLPPGGSKLTRAQGVLVMDEEIMRIVEFIGPQAGHQFEPDIHKKLQKRALLPSDLAEDEDEELVEQALEVIRQTNRASVSVLQRRLRIGYTRAARIMDHLEEQGVVGPNKGAEPRDILVDLDEKVKIQS